MIKPIVIVKVSDRDEKLQSEITDMLIDYHVIFVFDGYLDKGICKFEYPLNHCFCNGEVAVSLSTLQKNAKVFNKTKLGSF